ncbi:MAG TPA: ABC transporter substrate-binding protein, partial [Achromobacter sp.]|nr:ABC transporter substrate-binding protein [Achromobacter sp.]
MIRPCLTLLRRAVAPALIALALAPAAPAAAKDKEPPIRIGEINS